MAGGRVLRIVTRLNRGGPLRQLEGLVPRLAARDWGGPVLAGSVGSAEVDATHELEDRGVDVHRIPPLRREADPVADVKALTRIVRAIREHAPDVVHTHLGKAGVLGRLAAAWCRVPVIHTYHGHHFQAGWPGEGLARSAERSLGLLTTRAIALTERQRRDLVETHRVLAARKVVTIAPGLDVQDVRARSEATDVGRLRSRLLGGDGALFLWAGRFVGVKDPYLLVEAARRAPEGIRLVMLGGGPLRSRVRDRIAAAGIEGRVFAPGAVSDVAPWIAASDAVVLSSRAEGASVFVLEAKALARAAIVPTVGGLPDVVDHGRDGLWVPPADPDALAAAMARLARDLPLAHRLGRTAASDVEARFGADRLADDTAALYDAVLRPVPSRG